MELLRSFLSRCKTFTFLRYYMNHNGLVKLPCFAYYLDKSLNVMTVNRSDILNTHILKKHARNKKLFDSAFGLTNLVNEEITASRDF